MLLIHVASCLFLTGLIWTIQMVHYPSFIYVAPDQFEAFNVFHQKAITYVVAPLMILELVTALWLWLQSPKDILLLILLGMVGLIWLSTFTLSVPLHAKLLNNGFDRSVVDQLVLTNWPRTLLWSLRSVILLWVVRSAFV